MHKVFITGGAGCIGYAAAKYFKKQGFDVVTYDIIPVPNVVDKHVVGTIMYTDEMYKAMIGCDCVLHLAAQLGVARTEANRVDCMNINITGTKNVLDACVHAGIKVVGFASSSEVYGEPEKNPVTETDRVCPKSVYAVSKIAGEEYVRAYKQRYGLDFVILRFFNAYGPGQVAEFVVPRFVDAVLKGRPPVVYGDGKQTRCYCHVDDTAQGIYLALTSNKASQQVFNIGNDQTTISVKELAVRVIELSGKSLEPVFVQLDASDRSKEREIYERIGSFEKAKKLLGFNPLIGLEQGLKNVLTEGVRQGWA